jgi:hypothetical protein
MPILPQDDLKGIRLAGPGYEAAYPLARPRERALNASQRGMGNFEYGYEGVS